jgi:hypothetical protein
MAAVPKYSLSFGLTAINNELSEQAKKNCMEIEQGHKCKICINYCL